MNKIALALIRRFEGCRLRPYLCPAGIPTIGYGNTRYTDGRKVSIGDGPIGREEAEGLLQYALMKVSRSVFRLCPVLMTEDEGKQAGIFDFVFNLGSGNLQASTLRRRINGKNWDEAAHELRKWVYGGGRKLKGLIARRNVEASFFEEGQ